MNGGDGGYAAVVMEMMINPPRIFVVLKIRCPRACSPSRSLPNVRFLWVLVSLDLRYLIRLQRARLFNKVEQPPYDTGGSCPYGCPLNSLESPLAMVSLPSVWIIAYGCPLNSLESPLAAMVSLPGVSILIFGAYLVFIVRLKPFFKSVLQIWDPVETSIERRVQTR
jgi:hypothetical protein